MHLLVVFSEHTNVRPNSKQYAVIGARIQAPWRSTGSRHLHLLAPPPIPRAPLVRRRRSLRHLVAPPPRSLEVGGLFRLRTLIGLRDAREYNGSHRQGIA